MNYTLFFVILLHIINFPVQAQSFSKEKFALQDQLTIYLSDLSEDAKELFYYQSQYDLPFEQRMNEISQIAYYKKINQFYQDHQDTYQRLRTQDIKQLIAPPAALKNLQYIAITPEDELYDFIFDPRASIFFNIRNLSAEQLASGISNVFNPTILDFKTDGYFERMLTMSTFGSKLYAEQLTDSVYRIYAANRLYTLVFNFNTAQSSYSEVSYSKLNDPAYTHIIFPKQQQFSYPLDAFRAQIQQLIWDRYDTIAKDSLSIEDCREWILKDLKQFHQSHKEQFLQLRTELLKRHNDFKKEDVHTWKLAETIAQISPNKLEFAYTYFLDIEDINQALAVQISNIVYGMDSYSDPDLGLKMLIGYQLSSRKTHQADTWEIAAEGDSDRLEYLWNIETGEISRINYFLKK